MARFAYRVLFFVCVLNSLAANAAEQLCDASILDAIAYRTDDTSSQKSAKVDPDVLQEKDVIVAMVDNATKRVISSYQSKIVEDAVVGVGNNSLLLDTESYQLAPNVRAFGLRFRNAHGKCLVA